MFSKKRESHLVYFNIDLFYYCYLIMMMMIMMMLMAILKKTKKISKEQNFVKPQYNILGLFKLLEQTDYTVILRTNDY